MAMDNLPMALIGIKDMKRVILQVGVAQREPLLFHGTMGIGKSQGIHQAMMLLNDPSTALTEQERVMAEEYRSEYAPNGAELVDIRLSQYDSVDMRGLPEAKDGLTVWNMPSTIPFKGNPKFDENKLIFLFLDEFGHAEPAVQRVAYQLVNDRRIGEHELMDNVVIIAATNLDSDKGHTNKIAMPLLDRVTQFQVFTSPQEWCDWARASDLSMHVIGFIEYMPTKLHTYDPKTPQKIFATHRSWTKAARYWADPRMDRSIKIAAIKGAVGEAVATEFLAFVDLFSDLVKVEQVEKDPDGAPLPKDLAQQYATVIHLISHLTDKNAEPIARYNARMAKEFQVLFWKIAKRQAPWAMDTNSFRDFVTDPVNRKIIIAG